MTSPSTRKEVSAPNTGSIVKIRAICDAGANFCAVVCTQKAKAVQSIAENIIDQKLGRDIPAGNGSSVMAKIIPKTDTKNS
jgi:hypothetical protein